MRWEIQLAGDPADLRMLSKSLNKPELLVSEENGQFALRSTEFESLDSTDAVRNKARELITAMSGCARLFLETSQPIEVGAVTEIGKDGARNIFVSPEPAILRLRSTVSVVIKHSDGTIETRRPTDPVPALIKAALQHEVVARALRLRNVGTLEWVDLYRLYEVIESDVPRKNIESKGWATKNQIDRFKHTANSQKAVGDKARHGKDPYSPPKNPMSLSEARTLIDNLLKAWLQKKANSNV